MNTTSTIFRLHTTTVAHVLLSAGADLVSARMAGPLARSGFLWGRAAALYYSGLEDILASALAKAVSQDPVVQAGIVERASKQFRSKLLQENWGLLEVQRSAAACVMYPDLRTLAADEDEVVYGCSSSTSLPVSPPSSAPGQTLEDAVAVPQPSSLVHAAYDPAYVLLFGLAHLRESDKEDVDVAGSVGGAAGAVCRWGLTALAFRSLGSKDSGLR